MITWNHRKRERLDGFAGFLIYAPGASVLDLGCHRGLVCYEFAAHGAAAVTGVDIEPSSVAFAERLFEDVERCDAQFETNSIFVTPRLTMQYYDFVLLLGVYHKLKRIATAGELDNLMATIAKATRRYFIFNGSAEDLLTVNRTFMPNFVQVSFTKIRDQFNAVWERET